jgi:hypothetical protein
MQMSNVPFHQELEENMIAKRAKLQNDIHDITGQNSLAHAHLDYETMQALATLNAGML